ncbi:MAG: response regulator [bacterium]|nr:response regulator [bacterium]
MRFLVAEDDEFNRLVILEMLALLYPAADVALAADGDAAASLAAAQDFDVVLTDIDMPGLDGIGLLRKLREELGLRMPVISVTAFAVVGDRERLLMNGFDGYVSKPIDMDELRRVLDPFAAAEVTP